VVITLENAVRRSAFGVRRSALQGITIHRDQFVTQVVSLGEPDEPT
jgi:hypothetical protein